MLSLLYEDQSIEGRGIGLKCSFILRREAWKFFDLSNKECWGLLEFAIFQDEQTRNISSHTPVSVAPDIPAIFLPLYVIRILNLYNQF